ncbi:MAG TPA: sodium:proton antiporter [Firmicutes bacterium]|nr:sodium:proton antiporter [Bacillota bacterium]
MLSYKYLFDLALILLSTKLLGLLTKKFQMPQVVGALLAGLFLGPAMFNILHETEFITQLAELGVIVLMFTAGLETDLKELKNTGPAAIVIALFGIVISLLGGFLAAYVFNVPAMSGLDVSGVLQCSFIGLIIVSTSVSISVETLKELGKLNTRAGNTILGAAIIDDILGLVALTIFTSFADDSVSIGSVLFKVIAYFIFAIVVGYIVYKWFDKWTKRYNCDMRRFVIIGFVMCLLLSFISQAVFGISDIIGAFIAGLILSSTNEASYIKTRFETMSYMLLSPIFFASIGIKVDLSSMSPNLIWFTFALLIAAIFGKIVGCGIGAKLARYSNLEALQVGTGMIARGEVGLIIASKGAAIGLVSATLFAPIVVVVIITPIITPVLLKLVFASRDKGCEDVLSESLEESACVV